MNPSTSSKLQPLLKCHKLSLHIPSLTNKLRNCRMPTNIIPAQNCSTPYHTLITQRATICVQQVTRWRRKLPINQPLWSNRMVLDRISHQHIIRQLDNAMIKRTPNCQTSLLRTYAFLALQNHQRIARY